MHRWSTDQVDAHERFDHWREVRAKGLFGVTAELAPARRPDFFGEFSLRTIDTAGLIELRAASYDVVRGPRDISAAPSDSFCIYQQLGGGGLFATGKTGDFSIPHGAFATSYSDLPYRTAPAGRDGFHLRVLKMPVAGLLPSESGLHDLVARPLEGQSFVTPLLDSCFSELIASGDQMPAADAAVLVRTSAQLALIARGVAMPGSGRSREALRVGRLSAARGLIARNLSSARLSPALVAARLAISVRHLHVLFEATEMTFSQTVTASRLAQSCRLLLQDRDKPVADIAFACGFDSLATFYRAFRAAHAVTPSDLRARGSADR